MNEIKQFFSSVWNEIKIEFELVKKAKYSIPSDNAIMNMRTRININNYRGLYSLLCIVSVVLSLFVFYFYFDSYSYSLFDCIKG